MRTITLSLFIIFVSAFLQAIDFIYDQAGRTCAEAYHRSFSWSTPSLETSGVRFCDIVWLIASEHIYNITNIGLNIHSDSSKKKAA
jgi:hypothetical protein